MRPFPQLIDQGGKIWGQRQMKIEFGKLLETIENRKTFIKSIVDLEPSLQRKI